jgi:hypothetical protein
MILFLRMMFFIGFRSKKQHKNISSSESDSLVCKFVFDGLGHLLGESISTEGDLVIVKSEGSYLGIPLKHVESDGKKIIVKGLVDQQNAKRLGERWRRKEEKKEGFVYDK